VVAGELVAHLVRHVVDGHEVADRGRQAGAAPRLRAAADDAELRDAASAEPERDVPDVEVGGADDLAEHDLVALEQRARTA